MDYDSVLGFAVRKRKVQRHLILLRGETDVLGKLKSVDYLIRVGEASYASVIRAYSRGRKSRFSSRTRG
jgi:hypothetical protein